LSLSWARPIPSTPPHPISPRSILIIFSHLHLGLPSGLHPSDFHTNNLYAFLFSLIHATCPANLILNLIIIWWKVQIIKLTSSLISPNILHRTPFSNTLSPSVNIRDQVLQPYRTTGKTIVLYIVIFTFLAADEKTEGSGLNGSKPLP
jgi:hypothetical protein